MCLFRHEFITQRYQCINRFSIPVGLNISTIFTATATEETIVYPATSEIWRRKYSALTSSSIKLKWALAS